MANIKGFLLEYCVLFFEENIKCDISPRLKAKEKYHILFFLRKIT